jgi:hypothetical protein
VIVTRRYNMPRAPRKGGCLKWATGAVSNAQLPHPMHVQVGGFGTVAWIQPSEYLAALPDAVVLDNPMQTLHVGGQSLSGVSVCEHCL